MALVPGDSPPNCHQAYTAPEGEPCTRSGQLWVFECPGSGQRFAAPVPCGRLDCGTCRVRVRVRRGTNLVQRMGGAGIGTAVFTFPVQLHPFIGWRTVRNLRRAVAKVMKEWAQEIFGARIGFYVAFHPEGDTEPGIWKPHFHVGYSLLTDRGQVSGFRKPRQLLRLKALWSQQLTELADQAGVRWDCVTDEAGMVIPNIHVDYKTKPAEIVHRCCYDARPFPDWSASELDPSGDGERLVVSGMPVGIAQPVSYGLLSPRSKADSWRDAVSMQLDQNSDDELPDETASRLECRCCAEPQPLAYVRLEQAGYIDVVGLSYIHPETGEYLYPDSG